MEYKITMPRLTDTMETGKIIRWLKKVGDKVEKNEPIVEVESDKAVMEVPSFKEGVLIKILAEEGDEVPVGEPIAILETEEEKSYKKIKETKKPEKKIKKEEEKTETPKIEIEIPEIKIETEKLPEGTASPSAKKLASELGIDIKKLQEEGKLPTPAHEKDIEEFFYSKFFTKKALEIAKEYSLDIKEVYNYFKKKINEDVVWEYIEEKNIPQEKEISSIQKSLISNLIKSLEIPVYHIYQEFDFSLINWDEKRTFTAWFIKILADAMMEYPLLRTVYKEDRYFVYPSANISVAVATKEGELFAPVIKRANKLTLDEISDLLHSFKEKAENKSFSPDELSGGTFAVSNLGMFGIDFFDAIIPPFHSGIVAIGREKEDKKAILVFSFDHRVINGREGALFVSMFKDKFLDKNYLTKIGGSDES